MQRLPEDNNKECEFLEGIRGRCPDNPAVLEALGDLYTRIGRITDGLEIDEILTAKDPENETYWYNLACSYSLSGHLDDAVEALQRAIELGYSDADWMLKDNDLDALKELPAFTRLLGKLAPDSKKQSDT